MSTFFVKVRLGALLCILGLCTTYLYQTTFSEKQKTETGKNEIAQLEVAKNEVQRKPAKKVIWQPVSEYDKLYPGDAIKTSLDSEAKIKFSAGAEIDLEPESVVVIEEAGDKLNVDFQKGSLFVRNTDDSGNLSLKSGDTKIALRNADLSLGKTGNKALDVQVYRGVAEVEQGSKINTIDQAQQFLKIKSPTFNQRVYRKIDQKELADFEWVPISADFDVHLEVGAKRDLITAVAGTSSGNSGKLKTFLKAGVYYWRLVAVNKKDPKQVYQSPVNRVTLVAEVPAKLLSPAREEVVNPRGQPVLFAWSNPAHLVQLKAEVARDPSFIKLIPPEDSEGGSAQSFSLQEDGEYYWRVIGRPEDLNTLVVSPYQKFYVKTKFELVPPELKGPADQARLPFEEVSAGSAYLQWQLVPGIKKYHLIVQDFSDKAKPTTLVDKEQVELTEAKLPQLKPGVYRWFVTSVDDSANASKPSPTREFAVAEMPRISWTDGKDQERYFYVTEKPSYSGDWKSPSAQIQTFRTTLKSTDGTEKVANGAQPHQTIELPKPGHYDVFVEGFDHNAHVMAKSIVRSVDVQSKPLLPPPSFNSRTPASIEASKNGSIDLSWNEVHGAKQYLVTLKSESGKQAKVEHIAGTHAQIPRLFPGKYRISLASIDEFGRIGPAGQERPVTVPDVSDIRAPGIRRMGKGTQ